MSGKSKSGKSNDERTESEKERLEPLLESVRIEDEMRRAKRVTWETIEVDGETFEVPSRPPDSFGDVYYGRSIGGGRRRRRIVPEDDPDVF